MIWVCFISVVRRMNSLQQLQRPPTRSGTQPAYADFAIIAAVLTAVQCPTTKIGVAHHFGHSISIIPTKVGIRISFSVTNYSPPVSWRLKPRLRVCKDRLRGLGLSQRMPTSQP